MTAKGFIFDLDHTLYPDPENKNDLYFRAAVAAVMQCRPDLDAQSIEQNVAQSVRETRSELTYPARDYGIDPRHLHVVYHDMAVGHFEPHVTPDATLRDVFNDIGARNIVILTHSTINWASRLLCRLGIADAVMPDHILALDHPDISFERKDSSRRPFERAAARLNRDFGDIAMFDDLAKNLRFPHEMGMEPVLVTHGVDVGGQARLPHVSRVVNRVVDYFRPQ